MDWISVDERKPTEDLSLVLVCNNKGWMMRGQMAMYYLYDDCFVAYNPGEISKYTLEITHWYPVPELPLRKGRE